MNPDGSNARQLTTELVPVAGYDVTPDGSTLAWSAAGTVKTMGFDGSDERALTEADRFEYGPRFSPDGQRLVVGRRDASGADLGWWLVPLDPAAGDERQVLATGAPPLGSSDLAGEGIEAGPGTPAWGQRAEFSPDGGSLAVTAADGRAWHIDLLNPDPVGSAVDTGVRAAGPAYWGISGFVVVGNTAGEPADGLYTLQPSGSVRQFAAVGTVAGSSRGHLVTLIAEADGVAHVAAQRNGVTGIPALTDDPDLADRWPSFAPDGRTVVFARVRGTSPTTSAGIWLIDTETGQLTQLSTDGAYPRWLP
jgi:hypothetical protein